MSSIEDIIDRGHKNVVWAKVSIETIKQTPIWKESRDSKGKIPHQIFNEVLAKALIFLGHSPKTGGYVKDHNCNIRSNKSKELVYKTTLYTFPVQHNHKYSRAYEKNPILHYGNESFKGWGISHFKMDNFGVEDSNTPFDEND